MAMNDIIDYIKKAFEYKSNGDYKEAIDFFYKALALDNESTEIMVELADLYSTLCQYDRAVSFYEQVISKSPDNYVTKYAYALLLKKLCEYEKAENLFSQLYTVSYEIEKVAQNLFSICIINEEYEKLIEYYNAKANSINSSENLSSVAYAYSKIGKEDIAEQYYKDAYLLNEENIEAGINIIESLIKKNKYADAEVVAKSLLKYSESDSVLYLLGEIYYAMSLYDNALRYYSYAIKANPQNSLYYFKIAILFSVKGFFKEAEEAYGKAISIEPNNVIYNYALAYMYYLNKKNDLAEKLVDFILFLDAENMQANSLKVVLLVNSEKVAEAREYIQKLLNMSQRDDFSFYAESYYYSKLNMWDNALFVIKKAMEQRPDSLEYRYQYALYSFNLSKYKEAEEECNRILNQNTNYIQAYLLLAEINIKNQNIEEAVNNIIHVIKLDKNNIEAHILGAKIDTIRQKWDEAIEKYKIAVSINPSNIDLYLKIAECYFNIKKYEEAYLYYKEASDMDIATPECRFYMAKCCELLDDIESAIVNYSILKRIAPYNLKYLEEYANFLYKINRKKVAINLIKSVIKNVSNEDKIRLRKIIDSYK